MTLVAFMYRAGAGHEIEVSEEAAADLIDMMLDLREIRDHCRECADCSAHLRHILGEAGAADPLAPDDEGAAP